MPAGEAAVRPRPCPVVARGPLIHLDRICMRPGLYPLKQRGPSRGDSETSPPCLLTKFPSVHVCQVSVEEGKESSRQTGRGRERLPLEEAGKGLSQGWANRFEAVLPAPPSRSPL